MDKLRHLLNGFFPPVVDVVLVGLKPARSSRGLRRTLTERTHRSLRASCGPKMMMLKLHDGVDLGHDVVSGHLLDTVQESLATDP